MKKIKNRIKRIIKITFEPEMRILPGNIAFAFTVSVVPILSIIMIIGNTFNLTGDMISNKLGSLIPPEILNTLLTYMQGSTFNSIFLIISGIWTASMGANALIIASNEIYKFELRPYLERRVKAFILTLLLIVLVLVNLFILVFGNEILETVLSFIKIDNGVLPVFSFIKWPIAIIVVYIIVKIIYTVAPDKRIRSKSTTKGALFTTIVWMISSAGFSYYATNIADYSKFYGGLASIVVMMMWLYILSYILVLGMAINSADYKESHIEKTV